MKGIKLFAVIFFIIIILFVGFATFLAFKNDFSTEIESMLFKTIGAIAVSLYFVLNSFIIKPKAEKEIKVSTAMVYERSHGLITTPYTKHTGNRPEEQAMFKGLDDLNHIQGYNAFNGMAAWNKLRVYSNADNNEIIRLEVLELVFFQWLARHASWLKVDERMSFSESGWGGGANLMEQTESNSKDIELNLIDNANQFIEKYPIKVTFPSGAKLERKTTKHSVDINIITSTGTFNIQFFAGLGGVFQHNPSSKLSNQLNNFIKYQLRSIQSPNIWLDYPQIIIKYKPSRWSQFSDQAKREEEWFSKVGKYLYKDFSWDLLREYYSVDFQAALSLYRSKHGELN